jgi:hypothetical protein
MDTSAFEADTWSWPSHGSSSQQGSGTPPAPSKDPETPKPKRQRHYLPRTCRICLETVLPTFNPTVDNLPRVLNPTPSVSYISSDPAAGRLLRPCKCKGSSRYVHEGCLQAWRHADPRYGRRNYWQCPTCGFKYRLERMQWGRWISSPSKFHGDDKLLNLTSSSHPNWAHDILIAPGHVPSRLCCRSNHQSLPRSVYHNHFSSYGGETRTNSRPG